MNDDNRAPCPDPALMIKLATSRMPFGRYKGRLLMDLPEPYLEWFSRKGFPEGQIGDLLRNMHEIKLNGLEYLLKPIRVKTE